MLGMRRFWNKDKTGGYIVPVNENTRAIMEILDSAGGMLCLERFAGPPLPTRWQTWMVKWLPRWMVPVDAAEVVARRQNYLMMPKLPPGSVIRWRRPVPFGEVK
jgi:hypothetical protein